MRKMQRDQNGKYIDHYTNTVEDAAWFEATYNDEPERDEDFLPDRDWDPEFKHGMGCAIDYCICGLDEDGDY